MKKKLSVILILLFIIVSTIPVSASMEGLNDYSHHQEEDVSISRNMFDELLAGALNIFGDTFRWTLNHEEKFSIDSMVYNIGDNKATLNKGIEDPLTNFIFNFYLLFQYMAYVCLIPIGATLIYTFIRAGDSPQLKANLKDKGVRFFTSFILLLAMPQVIDLIFLINNTLVNVFYSVLQSSLGDANVTMKDGVLNQLNELANTSKTTAISSVYVMSILINLWMIFYYFIRDISITFLFLIFPIFAVFHPLNREVSIGWWREMVSNIIGQAIHAITFTTVIAMTSFTTIAGPISVPNAIWLMTAFGLTIPFTGIVKRLLRLEGSVGAGASMAGLGALYGAVRLGTMGLSGLKTAFSGMKSGSSALGRAIGDEKYFEQNQLADEKTGEAYALRDGRRITANSIANDKRLAGKQLIRSGSSMATGAWMGLGTSVMGLGTGSVTGGLAMGALGTSVGSKVGELAGGGIGSGLNLIGAKLESKELKGLSQAERDKVLGLNSAVLQGTQEKKQLEKAMMSQRFWNRLGMENRDIKDAIALSRYNHLAPTLESEGSMTNLKEAELYQDSEKSVLYSFDSQGNKRILRMGAGNENIKTPVTRKVEFNSGELAVSSERQAEFEKTAHDIGIQAVGKYAEPIIHEQLKMLSPDTSEHEYKKKYSELINEYTMPTSKHFNWSVYDRAKNSEYQKLIKTETDHMATVRNNTGINNIVFKTQETPYEGTYSLLDSDRAIYQMAEKPIETLNVVESWTPSISLERAEALKGVGYAIETNNGTTYFQVKDNGMRNIIGSGSGNTKLDIGQANIVPIKIDSGRMYHDEVRYAVDNTLFKEVKPEERYMVTDPKTQFGEEMIEKVNPGQKVIVTVNQNKNNSKGFYNYVDASTGEFLGTSTIPSTKIREEKKGYAYHIEIDKMGNFIQHGEHRYMSDVDYHFVKQAWQDSRTANNIQTLMDSYRTKTEEEEDIQEKLLREYTKYGYNPKTVSLNDIQ